MLFRAFHHQLCHAGFAADFVEGGEGVVLDEVGEDKGRAGGEEGGLEGVAGFQLGAFAAEHAVSVAAEVFHGAAAPGVPAERHAVAGAQILTAHHLAEHLVGGFVTLVAIEVLEILEVAVAEGFGQNIQREDTRSHGRVAIVPDPFQCVDADILVGALEDVGLQEHEVRGAVHLPVQGLAKKGFQVFDVGFVAVVHVKSVYRRQKYIIRRESVQPILAHLKMGQNGLLFFGKKVFILQWIIRIGFPLRSLKKQKESEFKSDV